MPRLLVIPCGRAVRLLVCAPASAERGVMQAKLSVGWRLGVFSSRDPQGFVFVVASGEYGLVMWVTVRPFVWTQGGVMQRRSFTMLTAGVVVGLMAPVGGIATASETTPTGDSISVARSGLSLTVTAPREADAGEVVTITGRVKHNRVQRSRKSRVKAKLKLQHHTPKSTKARKANSKSRWITIGKTTTTRKGTYSTSLTMPEITGKLKLRAIAKTRRPRARAHKRFHIRITPTTTPPAVTTPPATTTPVAPEVPSQQLNPGTPTDGTPTDSTPTPPPPCTVTDINTGEQTSGSTAAQQTIDAATADATLNITGICNESDITINKNLTLTGDGTIDARQQGRVLINHGADLIISGDLTLTGGLAPSDNSMGSPYLFGGGIYNQGGTVQLAGSVRISNNEARADALNGYGGGIFNDGSNSAATLILNGGSITNNTASEGGGIYNYGGMVELNDGSITNNTAEIIGGGVVNDGSNSAASGTARLTLTGGSITNNTAEQRGGGISNHGGMVELTGGSITNNTAEEVGGGMHNSSTGTVELNGGTITGNTSVNGGGIFNFGTVTLDGDATITGNTAQDNGGGIFNNSGTVTLNGNATITGNTAQDNGGGIYNSGTLEVNGSSVTFGDVAAVSDNTAPANPNIRFPQP